MCGLAGFMNLQGGTTEHDRIATVQAMTAPLVPRGPDGAGAWTDPNGTITLGFRRLAILDLSAEGHQPMTSRSGRYVIAYNGEIYNHAHLRSELENLGHTKWRGHSDTEVLIEAIDQFGFVETLEKLNGMFAIALWDCQDKALYLARDRFGEKPLYYGKVGKTLLFGSELKALRAHPHWQGDVDWPTLSLFLRHSYIPAPYSAYTNIRKLPPGTWLKVDNDLNFGHVVPYWSASDAAISAMHTPFTGSFDDAVDTMDQLLGDAVGMRMQADVPLGAFLSGGIDSTTVVALMQRQAAQPVRTFSVSFQDQTFDEAPFAAKVAQHIGTQHTELSVSERECLDVLPTMASIYDEPFGDASQIPTTVLSQLTRQHVTVALSGDGGDELFCGYGRYIDAPKLWHQVEVTPQIIRSLSSIAYERLKGSSSSTARRLRKRFEPYAQTSAEALYREYTSWWTSGDAITPDIMEPTTILTHPADVANLSPLSLKYSVIDAMTYLPDDLMVKVDRASMAASLEVRAPLLDHRIAEFAWSLPEAFKIDGNGGKRILKDVLYRHVPRELVERPKHGFEPPIKRWLMEGLQPWADDLLSAAALQRCPALNAPIIAKRWQEHRSGQRNWAFPIWNVLMLQSWLETL